MPAQQKTDAIKYIADFINTQSDESKKDAFKNNIECYRILLTNPLLYRWIAIEKQLRDQTVCDAIHQSGLWEMSVQDMFNKATKGLKEFGVATKNDNIYSLQADQIKVFLETRQVQTVDAQDVELSDGEYDDIFAQLNDSDLEGQAKAAFDSIDESDLGVVQKGDDEFDDFDENQTDLNMGEDEDAVEIPEGNGEDEDDEDDWEADILNNDDTTDSESETSDTTEDLTEQDDKTSGIQGISDEEIKKREAEAEEIRKAVEEESNRVEIPIDKQDDHTLQELRKIVKNTQVKDLMETMTEMYQSCFSGITSVDGILTNKGLLKYEQLSGEKTKSWHMNHTINGGANWQSYEYSRDIDMICYAYGVLDGGQPAVGNGADASTARKSCLEKGRNIFGYILQEEDNGTRFPKYSHALKDKNGLDLNIQYPYMQQAFMTGYYALCDGLKKEAAEKNYIRNQVKVTNWKDLQKWIEDQLVRCIALGLHEAGIKLDQSTDNVAEACKNMKDKLKNVVAIVDNQKSYCTIKMCQNVIKFDKDRLEKALNDYLDFSGGGQAGSRAIVKSIKNDVATVDIVRDMDRYNSAQFMAQTVIDNIIESGSMPSWDDAILGKDDNGIVNYNFEKSDRCAVALYGQSGSGKGLMTQSLLQNALIDNCNLFYFDGKPDNGAALAKIAWDRGKEAAVYNGFTDGSKTFPQELENFQHGIRDISMLQRLDDMIPNFEYSPQSMINKVSWPFYIDTSKPVGERGDGEQNRQQLYAVQRVLESFHFICDMVNLRANNRTKDIDGDKDFCVFVVDELQNAAKYEKAVRKAMAAYMKAVGEIEVTTTEFGRNGQAKEKKDGKIKDIKNMQKDPGYLFCYKWLNWANSIVETDWTKLKTIQLRNSRCTVIMIFQTNDWLAEGNIGQSKNITDIYTRIGKMVQEMSDKVVRIVGKGGLTSSSKWGDKDKRQYPWNDEVETGKWAVGATEGAPGLDRAQIVKPFRIFTTDLGEGVQVSLDDKYAGGAECRKDKNGEGKDPLGLDSYTAYLFSNLRNEILQRRTTGLTAEEVLQKGYDYFNAAVKETGKAENMDDYFYNLFDLRKELQDMPTNKQNDDDDDFDEKTPVTERLRIIEEMNRLGSCDSDESSEESEEDETSESSEASETSGTDESSTDYSRYDFGDSNGDETMNFDGSTDDNNESDNNSDSDNTDSESDSSNSDQSVRPAGFDTAHFEFGDESNGDEDYSSDNAPVAPVATRTIRLGEQGQSENFETDLSAAYDTSEAELDSRNNYQRTLNTQRAIQQVNDIDSVGQMSQILRDQNLQAENRLQILMQAVERFGITIDQLDCPPVDAPQIHDEMTEKPNGQIEFTWSGNQKPHTLNPDTIQLNNSDLAGCRGPVTNDRDLQNRYDAILDALSRKVGGDSRVVRLALTETMVQANSQNVYLGNVLDVNTTVADIVSITKTFNRFGNLKKLWIDLQILGEIQGEYEEDNPIKTMFMRCPSLQAIVIFATNGEKHVINRNEADNMQQDILDTLYSQQLCDKIDAISASQASNEMYRAKPVQVRRRVERTAARMDSGSFSRSRNSAFQSGQAQRVGRASVRRQSQQSIGREVNSIFNRFSRRK